MASKTRETTVETRLREGVEALGGACEKFVSPGTVGVPDRLICWPGGQVLPQLGVYPITEFVETKAPKGKLESWQARDHERRIKMGYIVHVLWNIEQVEQYLRARGKK